MAPDALILASAASTLDHLGSADVDVVFVA